MYALVLKYILIPLYAMLIYLLYTRYISLIVYIYVTVHSPGASPMPR